jgi:hypothetical protein
MPTKVPKLFLKKKVWPALTHVGGSSRLWRNVQLDYLLEKDASFSPEKGTFFCLLQCSEPGIG